MSLLQEIQGFPKYLNDKYHRDDMSEVLDKYCETFSKLPQENIADYVLEADKERFNEGNYVLNSGHIYTGVMNDQNLFTKFENWFNDTYILDSDLSKYESIEDTISHHLDSRAEGMVVSHLLDNGLKIMKDKETIQNALFDIDQRYIDNEWKNHNAKLNGDNHIYGYFMSKEFEKALQKTCYIIANQHDPLELAEYISKDLDLRYNNELGADITFDNYADTPIKVTIKEPNYKRLSETLSNSLQNAVNYIIDNTRYFNLDESDIDEALNLTFASNYDIEDVKEQYEIKEMPSDEPVVDNSKDDTGKEM